MATRGLDPIRATTAAWTLSGAVAERVETTLAVLFAFPLHAHAAVFIQFAFLWFVLNRFLCSMADPRASIMADPRASIMADPRANTLVDPRASTLVDPRDSVSVW